MSDWLHQCHATANDSGEPLAFNNKCSNFILSERGVSLYHLIRQCCRQFLGLSFQRSQFVIFVKILLKHNKCVRKKRMIIFNFTNSSLDVRFVEFFPSSKNVLVLRNKGVSCKFCIFVVAWHFLFPFYRFLASCRIVCCSYFINFVIAIEIVLMLLCHFLHQRLCFFLFCF